MVGELQARAYFERHNIRYKLEPPVTHFKFGDGIFPSLGKMEVRILTKNGSYLKIDMDVVSADIPILLGLDVLDRESIVACNVHNELQATHAAQTFPLTGKFGNLYLSCTAKRVLFTRP